MSDKEALSVKLNGSSCHEESMPVRKVQASNLPPMTLLISKSSE